ncbi:MAG: 50S ribosomal protein L24 [Candidatus Spechtbacteria bacterium]|nr:50S ribosomal protein L24 [Candidatus Spechtbacteria bacterium]
MKLKKGDIVVITKGKDRGKKAKILRAFPSVEKIMVEGVNIHKRHRRRRSQREKGQIISMPVPFSVSNVKIVCGKCNRAARVQYQGHGKEKVRICSSCSEKL